MPNRLVLDGLAELRQQLRNLPAELAGEASHIVEGAANGAADAIRSGYTAHRRSGRLAGGVKVTHQTTNFGAMSTVRSTAKEASVFEVGSQARHTALGANRGSMPPGHVFVPAVVRAKRVMWTRLKEIVVRHGLQVSGEP